MKLGFFIRFCDDFQWEWFVSDSEGGSPNLEARDLAFAYWQESEFA